MIGAARRGGGARLAAALAALGLLQGCATLTTPAYEPGYANVEACKAAVKVPVDVGAFAGGPAKLSVRGSPLVSSVGSGYADYLQAALAAELRRAGLLRPGAPSTIQGTLVATDVDGSGVTTGHATIGAEFVVTRDGRERYRRRHSARHEWPSSFVGGIAIPRAVQNFPPVVAALLRQLYADPAFVQALGPSPGD